MERHLEWTSPAPLWRGDLNFADTDIRRGFRTPVILRFGNDNFMPEFLDLLKVSPNRLNEYVAMPETWDAPPSEPAPAVSVSGFKLKLVRLRAAAVRRLETRGVASFKQLGVGASAGPKPLKLYQPAHQRYYLVATCLVCRNLGLPDRRINTSAQEKVTYVIRMLRPHANAAAVNPDPKQCDELALIGNAWQAVSNPETMLDGETEYPLSPVSYAEDDQRRRRLLVGLIPVAKREALLAASQPAIVGQDPPPPLLDTRQMLLKTKLFEPWAKLEQMAGETADRATRPPTDGSAADPAKIAASLLIANNQVQAVSYYILLDFAHWLEANLNPLWLQLRNNGDGTGLPAGQGAILTTLNTTSFSGTTLGSALKLAYDAAAQLETATTRYAGAGTAGWPTFAFQFVTATTGGVTGLTPSLDRKTFEAAIAAALPASAPLPSAPPSPPVRLTAQSRANPNAPVWMTIRCVLERPNCSALSPALVSEPTASFQLAAFFDPDAPARPIRIGLPVDTTPAGLRKFDKNTAFVMSDVLCGQVSKMASVTFLDLVLSILPFPLHKDLDSSDMKPCTDSGISVGMVCSFSIPIITICALILLIIFVKLLDIIFFWLPFFQICLPLPKFTAKEQ